MLEKRGPRVPNSITRLQKIRCVCAIRTLHATLGSTRARFALLGLEVSISLRPTARNMIRDAAGKLTGLVGGMETWLSDHSSARNRRRIRIARCGS